MNLRVLGCGGGEQSGRRLTSFLLNGCVLLDAGAATGALLLEEQARIRAVLLSHSHLDHVVGLAFLADNLAVNSHQPPVPIFSIPEVLDILREHLFNDLLWPDFTRLPSRDRPVFQLSPLQQGAEASVEGLAVTAIPVDHTLPAVGYLIRDQKSAILYTGDTGPTEKLWAVARECQDLKAVIVETSFPDRLEKLAKQSGHLTPGMLKTELAKLSREVPVLITHLKPPFVVEIQKEIAAAKGNLVLLEDGQQYSF
ncbi:MAG TPA: 3',5'-cyclic-nucleotide phosphodiesterase [Methylomirabilota bacterium]|nr:3',5'-cyclic-nucleotide phosphodiesterase [Methylomirabilota bacterium]